MLIHWPSIALVREFELLETSNILPSASDQTPADLRTTSPAKPPIDISGPGEWQLAVEWESLVDIPDSYVS